MPTAIDLFEKARRHERLDAVPATDLERHDGAEGNPTVLLHQTHRAREGWSSRKKFVSFES